jgi:hypothetical protein
MGAPISGIHSFLHPSQKARQRPLRHKILIEGINERIRGREEDKEIFLFLQI